MAFRQDTLATMGVHQADDLDFLESVDIDRLKYAWVGAARRE